MRRLGLTRTIAVLCALAVTLSIAAVSVLAFATTRSVLRSQVDRGLEFRPAAPELDLDSLPSGPPGTDPGGPGSGDSGPGIRRDLEAVCSPEARTLARFGSGQLALQLIRPDGTTCGVADTDVVPVNAAERAVTRGGAPVRRDAETSSGRHVRVNTRYVTDGYAVMVVRDLSEIDTALSQLAAVLGVATLLGGGLALSAGLVVARTALRPVDRLTRAAEHVSRTQELHTRIPADGNDEVARLSRAFNDMTASLDESRARQAQLVVDAGHELRTPLTSMRTNIELLQRSEAEGRRLDPHRRNALLTRIVAQLDELANLTEELTELTRAPRNEPLEPLRLDDVVRAAAERAGLRAEQVIRVDAEPWETNGDAAQLERALVNLADNAVKFSPPGGTVWMRLRVVDPGTAEITVDDEGPGVDHAEWAMVFERFWRSDAARGRPGSGLGLAIVADAVARHRGSVTVGDAPGGGARFAVRLPGRRPPR